MPNGGGITISTANLAELERAKKRYELLRDGGDDLPDWDWMGGLDPEKMDALLDKIIAEREAK